ncbi:MAG: ABC transporter ATP-binding protein [Sneathiella sp.]|nr:ABC transporter ATP-binding protein [Sneathiella sp.]
MGRDNHIISFPFKGIPTDVSDQGNAQIGLHLRLDRLAFGDTLVVDDLDLTLEPGKITCLLGPSGVGKSSILKILAGFIPLPEKSSLTCSDGEPVTGRISYMDQHDLLLPWASVLDNLVIGARLRGEAPDVGKARDLLHRVGLADRYDARPAALSGGMRQRVALARTLMEGAPIVLMDEPFSALDAITRFRLQDLTAGVLGGKTVLLITHDPLEALRLGHAIYVLSGNPVALSEPLLPEGTIPRDPADDMLKHHYSEIMTRLAASTEEAP